MKENIKLYLWLCYTSLFISTFTFGGGYVVVPMIRKYYVAKKKLFSEEELMEMAAIAQSSPGAIAVNLSILAGKRAAGAAGVIINSVCSIIPSIVILGLVSSCYAALSSNIYVTAVLKGMQACVAALIIDVIVDMYKMILKERSRLLNLLVPFSFISCTFLNINVMLVLVLSCLICLLAICLKFPKGKAAA